MLQLNVLAALSYEVYTRRLPFEALRRESVASQLELYRFLPGSAAGVALWAPGGAFATSAFGYRGVPLPVQF